VDIEAAEASVVMAESALTNGNLVAACDHALAAHATAVKPFIPGEEGEWVDHRRAVLRGLLLRALDVLGEARLGRGETALAVEAGEEAIALDPYRERTHRLLMAAYAAAGSRAEALRAYERLRRLFAEDLGVEPSDDTEAAYLALLGKRV
jgi:DNA-binding SARP family transcriptional activator